MTVLSSIWLAGCSVFGIRDVKEPPYQVQAHLGAIAVRRYAPRIVAETTVPGSALHARDLGFRRIAGYIFGGNHRRAKIAMTAPVSQQPDGGRRIGMTAPVTQRQSDAGQWTISFFMPAGSTLQTLPQPDDSRVTLALLPSQSFAVLGFSGTPSPQAVAREEARLLSGLHGSIWLATAAPVAWFYDPPWTLPPLRRNEVAVAVSENIQSPRM